MAPNHRNRDIRHTRRHEYDSWVTSNCNCMRDIEHRTKLRNIWIAGTAIIVCVVLPILIWALLQEHEEDHIIAWLVSGVFVMLTLPIAFNGIILHLHYFSRPILQRYIIRILLMVPIYAVDSWLALRFKNAAIYIDTMRECYESYVIYNFVFFLIACMGDEETVALTVAEKPPQRHLFPFYCCLKPWNMTNGQFLNNCKHGVLSYTVVRLITSLSTLVMQSFDIYHEGDYSFQYGYIYVLVLNNCSQIWALYCLALLYVTCKEELAEYDPLPKFLSVKAVVFFSWWQSVAISLAMQIPMISKYVMKNVTRYSELEVSVGFQNFLICIEMFIAAIVHHFAFSHEQFARSASPRPFLHNVSSVFDVSDVKEDVVGHVKHVLKETKQTLATPHTSFPRIPGNAIQLTSTSTMDNDEFFDVDADDDDPEAQLRELEHMSGERSTLLPKVLMPKAIRKKHVGHLE